jgi:ribosomal protein L15E
MIRILDTCMMHAQWNILEFGEREMHARIQRERKEERKMRVSEVRMKGPARGNVTTILGLQADQLP